MSNYPTAELETLAKDHAERVAAVLRASAHMDYIGESVSQLEHALQCAKFAADSGTANRHLPRRTRLFRSHQDVATGADEETVLGAMLHDVGHLQLDVDQDESSLARMGAVGVQNHEVVGASYLLRLGFSDKVAQLVCGHVQAKVTLRTPLYHHLQTLLTLLHMMHACVVLCCVVSQRYLVWKHDNYARKLSPASKLTLEYQGGPMNDAEAQAFEKSPMFDAILKLRSWDDKAKVVGLQVPDLDHYLPMMVRHIRHNLGRHDA